MKDIELQTEAFKRYIQECDELSITPDCASAFNAAWNARAAVEADRAQRVPDGWKMVPVEPTEVMLAAGDDVLREAFRDRCIATQMIYDAMLASTPAPAQQEPNAVAYLDIGAGGYMDLGTDMSDEALSLLPKGRHMLVIAGTYGVDGYTAVRHQEPPQQERKPMTDEQIAFAIFEARQSAGPFIRDGSLSYRIARAVERHHGIRKD